MFKLLSKKILTVKPESSLCVRMYHKNAACSRCLDVCPVDAINIGRPKTGVAIYEDRCVNCELCVSACPYGVFKRTGVSEKDFCDNILKKAQKNILTISCNNVSSSGNTVVECIGSIHAIYLIYWLYSGIKEINLKHKCEACALKSGSKCISSQLRALNSLCQNIKNCSVVISHRNGLTIISKISFPEMKKEKQLLSRRDFFRNFGKEITKSISNTVDVVSEHKNTKINFETKSNSERIGLFSYLSRRLEIQREKLAYDDNIPAGSPTFSGNNCNGCRLCVKLCPFGAIQSNGDESIEINTEKCTGCNICKITCPSNFSNTSVNSEIHTPS